MTQEQLESIRAREKAASDAMDFAGGITFEFRCRYGDDNIAVDIPLLLAEIDRLSGIESAAIKLRERFEFLKGKTFETTIKKFPTPDEWQELGAEIDLEELFNALDGKAGSEAEK